MRKLQPHKWGNYILIPCSCLIYQARLSAGCAKKLAIPDEPVYPKFCLVTPMGLRTKESVRQAIWSHLEEANIADFPRPCFGRIPNFAGSREACERPLSLEEFKRARCVFSAPDYVLKKARDLVLKEGKTLAFATPHMRAFLEIEPHKGKVSTTIRNMGRLGRPLKTPAELILQGSVAVDRKGNRLGKGKGYGDKEVDWLRRHNLLLPGAPVVTIVHSSQIVEDLSNLMGKDDVPVDYILTEKEIIRCK